MSPKEINKKTQFLRLSACRQTLAFFVSPAAGAHECQIRSAPVLVLPRLQRFSITLKRRQRAKIKIILALCQQSETAHLLSG
ncbi:hypothetical protein, partial [Bacillus safensis]|uniref:hypothetical protein n=1 Tax=Bacillus safensis TaxID=561879 RepID=UPI002E1AA580|nr:hypothetical protein [Bacillus safensis]